MRGRLFISLARISLAVAILGLAAGGEPVPPARTALGAGYEPALASRFPEIPAADAPAPCATPTQKPADWPPTRITAPAIGLDAPVVEANYQIADVDGEETAQWEVPDGAAGFHKGTAYPGQRGNTVLSGHNNIAGEVFRRLADLQAGDRVTLYVGDTPYDYQVAYKEIVREAGVSEEQRRANARWILPTDDVRLTLVTCWPYTGNSHRVIVIAMPVP